MTMTTRRSATVATASPATTTATITIMCVCVHKVVKLMCVYFVYVHLLQNFIEHVIALHLESLSNFLPSVATKLHL
jgi:hypothetical protein